MVISAVQFLGTPESRRAIEFLSLGGTLTFSQDKVEIETPEGTMIAGIGDWIIRGVQGELYPCKPGVFEFTYESAEGPVHG